MQYYEESRKALGAPVQAPADAAGTAGEAAAQPAAGAAGGEGPGSAGAPAQGSTGSAHRGQQQQQSVPASTLRGGSSSAEQPLGNISRAKVQRVS